MAGIVPSFPVGAVAATPAVSLVGVLSGGVADFQTTDVSASPAVLAVAILASSVAALPPVSSPLVDGLYSG